MQTKYVSILEKLNNFGLNFKLNGKRLYPINSVKYLGVKLDKHLTWKPHIDGTSTKVNKANTMLSKIRHFVDQKKFKSNLPCHIRITLILFCFSLGTEF